MYIYVICILAHTRTLTHTQSYMPESYERENNREKILLCEYVCVCVCVASILKLLILFNNVLVIVYVDDKNYKLYMLTYIILLL
jgi:hypothetical protein